MFCGEKLNAAAAAVRRSSKAEKWRRVQGSDLWPVCCLLVPAESTLARFMLAKVLSAKLTPHTYAPTSLRQKSLVLTSSGFLSLRHLLYRGCKHVLTPKETTEGRSFASTHTHCSCLPNNLFHYSDPDLSIKASACFIKSAFPHLLVLN